MLRAMRPTYDEADRWNLQHPPGTAVIVRLANGATLEDRTSAYAAQWGGTALVTLQGRAGLWSTMNLQLAGGTFALHRDAQRPVHGACVAASGDPLLAIFACPKRTDPQERA